MGKSLLFGLGAGLAGAGVTAVGASLGLQLPTQSGPYLLFCAVVGAVVAEAKHSLTDMRDNRMHTLKNRVGKIRRDVGDIHGLVRLGPYTQELPLPMGGGWAMTGDSAALLAREVLVRKSETILELGSGASTLILGQILKKNKKGHLLSIDHDPIWANQTRRYVNFFELQDFVSVVDAPLKSIILNNESYEWYDIPGNSLDRLGPTDLLLFDGPPRSKNPLAARYPAFPVLRDRLSKKSDGIRGRCKPCGRIKHDRQMEI